MDSQPLRERLCDVPEVLSFLVAGICQMAAQERVVFIVQVVMPANGVDGVSDGLFSFSILKQPVSAVPAHEALQLKQELRVIVESRTGVSSRLQIWHVRFRTLRIPWQMVGWLRDHRSRPALPRTRLAMDATEQCSIILSSTNPRLKESTS